MEEKNTNLEQITQEEDKKESQVENISSENNNIEKEEHPISQIIEKEETIEATFSDYVKISSNFYAGFWLRFVAYMIDVTLVLLLGRIFNTITLGYLSVRVEILDSMLEYVICYYLYFFLMTYIFSQTLGKMIVRIKVEKKEGGKPSLVDVLFREVVGRFLNDMLKFIPYLVLAFTPKKKGLHDYISDTVVIKEDFSDLRQKLNDKINKK